MDNQQDFEFEIEQFLVDPESHQAISNQGSGMADGTQLLPQQQFVVAPEIGSAIDGVPHGMAGDTQLLPRQQFESSARSSESVSQHPMSNPRGERAARTQPLVLQTIGSQTWSGFESVLRHAISNQRGGMASRNQLLSVSLQESGPLTWPMERVPPHVPFKPPSEKAAEYQRFPQEKHAPQSCSVSESFPQHASSNQCSEMGNETNWEPMMQRNRIEDRREKKRKADREYRERVKRIKVERDEFAAEKERLTTENEQLKSKVQKIEAENVQLELKIRQAANSEALQDEIQRLLRELKEKEQLIEKNEANSKALQDVIQRLQHELEKKEQLIEAKMEIHEAEKKRLEAEKKQLEAEKKQLEAEKKLLEAEKELSEIRQKLSEVEKK